MRLMVLLICLFIATPQAWCAELSLDEFLNLVQQRNELLQSANAQAKGAEGLVEEADLLFSPRLFAETRTGFDEKMPTLTTIVYDRANTTSYSVGISKQFRTGLDAKLSYELNDSEILGAESVLGSNNRFADGTAQLELKMPLWANGFGRTARANEATTRQQTRATKYSALSQIRQMLSDAEKAYWRLVAALEQLKIEQQSLKAAQNIQAYVTGKNQKDLGEQADVLQANALVESYTLQVQLAENDVRSAQRAFNLTLNKEALEPIPQLEILNFSVISKLETPTSRPGDRMDVKASEAQALLADASSTVAKERNKPNLDLFASYASYGQSGDPHEALSNSTKFDKDGAYIGLRFSVPLDLSSQTQARNGAEQNRIAAERNLSYLKYSQEQQWADLVQNFADAKKSLILADSMESAQKAKLENERTRLRQGRTTTYQVLLFEQDYNQAQSSRIQAASRLLNLQAQTKLYVAHQEQGN